MSLCRCFEILLCTFCTFCTFYKNLHETLETLETLCTLFALFRAHFYLLYLFDSFTWSFFPTPGIYLVLFLSPFDLLR